jgi:uncharacterized phiE125 gp8 family phage protein
MTDRLVEPADGDAVSLELAKAHLVIDHTIDDALITQIIGAATAYAEEICNRGFVEQTWEAVFRSFPVSSCGEDTYLELKRGNLIDPTPVITYRDAAGASQTLATSVYLVDDVSVPGRIRLAPDQTWPTIQNRWDAVRVEYTVGWPDGDVPKPIVQALLLLIAQMYENRTPEITGTIVSKIEFSFNALLSPYRILAV